ncbi:MAG: nucleotidyltransferase family protein [Sulfurovaceae bacterium]|nr:nucleotidyltransferase family protein [Sulfurovaceae bacterium]
MSAENILLQLLGCGSSDLLPEINENKWLELIELAGKQHVIPYLYYHLKEIGALEFVSAESKDVLLQSFKQSTFRNMAIIAEFRRIADLLNKKNIPVVGLKGLQLVQDGLYPHIGLRFMRDIDLLVPLKQLRNAYDISLSLGYMPEENIHDTDLHIKYHHHIPQQFNYEKNIMLELHGYLENVMRIDPAFWWGNTKTSNRNIFLDDEKLLLHLCLHISYSDLFKTDLRHYLDIYMILKNKAINWKQFMSMAQEMGLAKGVLIVLDIVSMLFELKLSKEVDNFIVRDENHEESIKYAIEFMWQYRKSSKYYEQYRSKMFLTDEPLLKRFFKRVFIPKEELCCQYSLSVSSRMLYLYYFVRVYDLFKRHFISTIKSKTDQKQIDVIAKTKILHAYLYKD